jgi:hypothetical protein
LGILSVNALDSNSYPRLHIIARKCTLTRWERTINISVMNRHPEELKRRRTRPSEGASAGLSESFQSRLKAYATAAAAAGVGLFAATPPTEAEIVFTPAHTTFTSGTVFIDLNHDGFNDFGLSIYNFDSEVRRLRARGVAPQNGVLCSGSSGYPPLALKAGYRIGPNERYGTFDRRGAPAVDVVDSKFGSYVGGPLANVTNRFLGLKFKIDGQVHYGWAALSVKAGVSGHKPGISVTLLGYAYETIEDTTLLSGQTAASFGPAETVPQFGTLGMLALGAPALNLWRRGDGHGEGETARTIQTPFPTS